MSVAEIDSTWLNVWVVDDAGTAIGRPWITVARDKKSAMWLGHYLGFGTPSVETLMLCLWDAIRPQDYLDRYPKVRNREDAYGLPDVLLFDNGTEYTSKAFIETCRILGIEARSCPKERPHYKGGIERLFRTFMQNAISGLPGRTFPPDKIPPGYDAKKDAIMGMRELDALVMEYRFDIEAKRFHRGIKDVPLEVWQREFADYPPEVPENDDQLLILLSGLGDATIQRYGIEWNGLMYNSDELAGLRIAHGTSPAKVTFRYHRGDIGRIWVHDERHRRYIAVRASDPTAQGRRMDEQQAILRKQNEIAKRVKPIHRPVSVPEMRARAKAATAGRDFRALSPTERIVVPTTPDGVAPVTNPVVATLVVPPVPAPGLPSTPARRPKNSPVNPARAGGSTAPIDSSAIDERALDALLAGFTMFSSNPLPERAESPDAS